MQDMFVELDDTTIISVCKNFENLLYYDRIFVFNDGFIMEQGDPKELLTNTKSYLNLVIKNLDNVLFKLMHEYLDDGQSVIDIYDKLFNIPEYLKFEKNNT